VGEKRGTKVRVRLSKLSDVRNARSYRLSSMARGRVRTLLLKHSKARCKPNPWADSCFADLWERVPLPPQALFTLTFLKWSKVPSVLLRLQELATGLDLIVLTVQLVHLAGFVQTSCRQHKVCNAPSTLVDALLAL
jgi:hypothetical protein